MANKKRYKIEVVIKDTQHNDYRTKLQRTIEEYYSFKMFAIAYLKISIPKNLVDEIQNAIVIDMLTGKVVYEHPLR